MDVTSAPSIEAALDSAEAKFGPVQIVVNNAGVTATKPALQQEESDWDKVVDTNLKGVWLVAQAAGRRMVAHKVKGSIVNIASILGLRVASSVAPYAISKAGVVQMTKALALEWARYGIRVNAVAPGIIDSSGLKTYPEAVRAGLANIARETPSNRMGTEGEIAASVIFLLSPAAAYISGATLKVDGASSLYRLQGYVIPDHEPWETYSAYSSSDEE
jgi:NAD(P)-dependent dehydrogenase (short-subunit alcohol dehydrogenase family)